MDRKKKNLIFMTIAAITLVVAVLGATYAFFVAQGGGSSNTNIDVQTNTTDNLSFSVGDPITLNVTQANFAEGAGNQSDSTTASATLTANNATNNATRNYYLYFDISNNNFIYTVDEDTPELILTVIGPDNQPITSLGNLEYVTVGEGDTAVSGFDITTASDRIIIADNYEISATDTPTTQTWTITVTFVNLDTDQVGNTGKSFDADITIAESTTETYTITLANNNQNGTFNPTTPATLSCGGATTSYNQKYNRIEISQVGSENTNCTLTYETPQSKNYLNSMIMGLAGTSQGTGEVVNENGYRYEGKNPNNYIWFNNELWRIIGVFDESSHGQAGQNLVKIIRNNSIGTFVFDNDTSESKYGSNDWTTSDLMNLLNEGYLNSQDGTGKAYCYIYSTAVSGHCDFRESGINDTYRKMVKNVIWYLGGALYSNTATANEYYESERKEVSHDGRPVLWNGKIGLMYLSDYGYSAPASSCDRTTSLNSYNSDECIGQSWLYQNAEWTLTHEFDNIWRIIAPSGSSLAGYSAYGGNPVRPVLYLDYSVYVIDGNGTLDNPYQIAD